MKNKYSAGYLPIFDRLIIADHNTEGFDSVDSRDFEPGFGCVPAEKTYVQPLPPELPKQRLTADEIKRRDHFYMTENEKMRIEADHLAKHEIIF